MQIPDGDAQGPLGDLAGAQLRGVQVRPRRGVGEAAARADGDDALVRLDHVAGAGDEERGLAVRHQQERLQAPQDPVGAPVLGQLHRGAGDVPAVFLHLALEALEQREGVRRGAGKADEDLAVVDLADLARVGLHHGVAHGDLAVAGHGDRGSRGARRSPWCS